MDRNSIRTIVVKNIFANKAYKLNQKFKTFLRLKNSTKLSVTVYAISLLSYYYKRNHDFTFQRN